MSRHRRLWVIKVDGASEPFCIPKVQRCVNRALREASFDPAPAMPLAKAIAAHLAQTREVERPQTEFIFQCVHGVLAETGFRRAAEALVRHRDKRSRVREQIRIFRFDAPALEPAAWSKSAVVATVQTEYRVRPSVARVVAAEIEAKIVLLGYRCLSSDLLESLIRNELSAWGLLHSFRACEGVECAPIAARPDID
ncbi:MAG: hypothetical protein CHACPFDD_04012 [Phycisphaerae bacterium]|nr:hypothetical protein [Phycisphaerae bacterium]